MMNTIYLFLGTLIYSYILHLVTRLHTVSPPQCLSARFTDSKVLLSFDDSIPAIVNITCYLLIQNGSNVSFDLINISDQNVECKSDFTDLYWVGHTARKENTAIPLFHFLSSRFSLPLDAADVYNIWINRRGMAVMSEISIGMDGDEKRGKGEWRQ